MARNNTEVRNESHDAIEQLENQIERLILEQRALNKRASSLQRRNLRLEELNKLKNEFIAVASHQLRTPATGVKQYLGLLLEGYADALTPSQTLFLEKADESNNRQLRIIDDLLQVARIDSESFKLHMSTLEIKKIIEKVVEDLQDKLKSRNQKIVYQLPDKPIPVRGDSERLRMVFENLIDNASNYSPSGTTITIKLRPSKNSAVIEIKDEGVGINRQDFPKLFQKFSRVPNPLSVEVGGTGLGLYWALKIATLHGGGIKVQSRIDKGSTFTVSLPRA
ncbi:MAG: multi-sensor signal transduction histidine kinase [Candidatus Saccharibacteria bacterium]|nr:multi-sensor signal transduction histidine kinase [Candidatus Saccharibacteria bacterium]